MFTQGSFMNSAQDTDMAITGDGFFQVRDRVTNELMYTRAGNFTFDADGLLETPAGYVLQGWQLSVPKPGDDPVRLGVPVDVKVIAMNAPPVKTEQIKVVANLNADDTSAYIYSASAWGELYFEQVGIQQAEDAREAASQAVFDPNVTGATDYVSPYDAFNVAYRDEMRKLGYYVSDTDPAVYRTTASEQEKFDAHSAIMASHPLWDQDYKYGSDPTIDATYRAEYIALLSPIPYSQQTAGLPLLNVTPNQAQIEEAEDRAANYPGDPVESASAYNTVMTLYGYVGVPPYTTGDTSPSPVYRKLATEGDLSPILSSAMASGLSAAVLAGAPSDYVYPSGVAAYDTAYATGYGSYIVNNTHNGRTFSLNTASSPLPNFFEVVTPAQTVIDAVTERATTRATQQAEAAGQLAYKAKREEIINQLESWLREGNGFAGAWDGTDLSSPIDPENYTHANPWTIYDSLGNAHTLMVYYQPNPYMENVWDYIITCDPTEDARKDTELRLFFEGATFNGLIQKGKITFSADGPDRHGGVVKDIEAQNIDLTKTTAAYLSSAKASAKSVTAASSITHYNIGGYFSGTSVFSATTKSMVDSPRSYTIAWVGNLDKVPVVSGFVWKDNLGNTGTIPVSDKNYAGPYPFGSGLNIDFSAGGRPMAFSSGDTVTFIAHSEQIGWTNLTPNELGYFDFDVAFVQSASMALHPPYPPGLETMTQHISLDMGARNPTRTAGQWILDEQGTTQYASKSINIFSSQDGYPAGSLQRVSIDKDGILTGIYTNGRHQPLYQIGLTRFINPWGLAKLGDNVYMETRWSGTGSINPPGYGGTGTIRANFLEQSNTDLADEIVNMIVTQRGFQANSKVVTTTDTMLAEVIEMKR
jgi:flagellar hook protein FlgE